MPDQKRDNYLGVSFSSNHIHFTELVTENNHTILDHVGTIDIDFNFEEDLSKYKSNNKALSNISSELQKYVNSRNKEFTKISLTIGTSQAFIIILPIDYSEGKQSMNSKIYWELSNYFPENYNDFIINTYRLNAIMPSRTTDEFLIIAVAKNTLEFVKRIFKLCNLNLSIVDIDHFAAEYNLRKNYSEEFSDKNVLLIGLKEGRFDYGLIKNKKYSYYTYAKYYSEPEYDLTLIKKLNTLIKTRCEDAQIETVYLYGEEIREDTIYALKKNNNLKVKILNPFGNISSSTEFLKNQDLRKQAHMYSPSCGVAFRSIYSKN